MDQFGAGHGEHAEADPVVGLAAQHQGESQQGDKPGAQTGEPAVDGHIRFQSQQSQTQ